jgi:tetratricopeptide (TPR) repeat protein
MTDDVPASLAEEAKRAYERGEFDRAADLFLRAAQAASSQGDALTAAEMNNNRSVSLLQAGKAKEALQAAQGTDQVFAAASDLRRQAMALGNQAAALEALHRMDEALVKKSMAAIQLKRGRVVDSAFNMVGSVEAKARPSLFERFLRFLLRFKPW